MRAQLETTFGLRIIRWAEPTDDGDLFEAITPDGRVVLADSPRALLLAATEDTVVALVPRGWWAQWSNSAPQLSHAA